MHEEDEDHIHLGDEDSPVYVGERVELLTVGVDVGSSTSHLLFSRLRLERQGQRLSSRFAVTEREVLYRSPVVFTPYTDGRSLDAERLRSFVEASYREAGVDPEAVHTGAVITTGEAARRDNARAVLELFSHQAGKFVCATAGPNLESLLAAHGSGAAELSRETEQPLLNVDIGGGTTKFAVCRRGRVEDTAALHVGARLVAWDPQGRLVRVEEAGRVLAARVGVGGSLELGSTVPPQQELRRLAEFMADLVMAVVAGQPGPADLPWITPPLATAGPFRTVVVSGGVGEYVYGREHRSFGDLGPELAQALRGRTQQLGLRLVEPKEAIRATCIGASQYTVQLSGDTIYLSHPELLPVRSVPAAAVRGISQPPTAASVAAAVGRALERLDLADGDGSFALAVHWHHGADYASLRELCAGIVQALPRTLQSGQPLLVVLDADVAGIVGELLRSEFRVPGPVLCVDQVALREFDYVDVGRPIQPQGVVPVVVKSLVFR
ncbi:MAG: ethanolamine ammonia-lyase reactivating factor EutA [Armatimonadota bacterium]|nr:ethanolamine ammonia-lyase reactivating factor EutA [Armatimonadota bacterium]